MGRTNLGLHVNMSVRMTANMAEVVEEKAKQAGITPSEWVRRAIADASTKAPWLDMETRSMADGYSVKEES